MALQKLMELHGESVPMNKVHRFLCGSLSTVGIVTMVELCRSSRLNDAEMLI